MNTCQPVNVVEYIVLPGQIQFAHHVVEQGDGLFPRHLPQHRRLGQLEGQHSGALLALGTIGPGGQAPNLHQKIRAMRSRGGEPSGQIRISGLPKPLQQPGGRLAAVHPVLTPIVVHRDGKALPAGRQPVINGGGHRLDFPHIGPPGQQKPGADAGQPGPPRHPAAPPAGRRSAARS